MSVGGSAPWTQGLPEGPSNSTTRSFSPGLKCNRTFLLKQIKPCPLLFLSTHPTPNTGFSILKCPQDYIFFLFFCPNLCSVSALSLLQRHLHGCWWFSCMSPLHWPQPLVSSPMPFRDKICISDAPFLTSAPPHIPIRQPISFSHLFPEAAHHEQDTQVLSSHDTETLCDLLLPHHLTPNRPCPRSVHSLLCIIPSSWQEKVFPLSSPGPRSSYPPPRTRTLLFRSLALLSPPLTHARTTMCIDPSEWHPLPASTCQHISPRPQHWEKLYRNWSTWRNSAVSATSLRGLDSCILYPKRPSIVSRKCTLFRIIWRK